jgi:hypothetical protein
VTPEGYFGRITGIAGVVGQMTSALSMLWLGVVLRFADGRAAFVVLGVAVLAVGMVVAVVPAPQVPAVSAAVSSEKAEVQ